MTNILKKLEEEYVDVWQNEITVELNWWTEEQQAVKVLL